MKTVVIGGTFAPPTTAHIALVRAARDFVGAEKCIWVPSSLSYMRIWRPDRIPEYPFGDDAFREKMLTALCAAENDMELYTEEMYREGGSYTFDTLMDIENMYGDPPAFVFGSDLIGGLPRWHRSEELLQRFDMISVDRDGSAYEALVQAGISGVRIMPPLIDYSDISATQVRSMLLNGDYASASQWLHPSVLQIIQTKVANQ